MKTLRAFWHWVDNDKPARITREHLSKTAVIALCMAEAQVAARAFGDGSTWSVMPIWDLCSSSDGTDPNARPEFFRPELVAAVRDLSLAICQALEAMHAAVPEAEPRKVTTDWLRPKASFEFQYLAEWIPSAMVPTDTFRGVDRTPDRLLSGRRVSLADLHRQPECPCRSCAAARAEASKQVQALGIEAQQYLVATHDGLVPFDPAATQPPSEQQRNEYEQRAQALQAVDATHPRNQGLLTQQMYLDALKQF